MTPDTKKIPSGDVRAAMDKEAVQAAVEFRKLMSNPKSLASDLVAFHQRWYMKAGHGRLGALYRDYQP